MIRNKRELLAIASQWMSQAANDLRTKTIEFIETSGVSEAELSDILGITMNEVEQILNGSGDIKLSTFAKILIATDNAIEIKPVGNTPLSRQKQPRNSRGQFMPRNPRQMPKMREGMPMPPMMDGYPMPPMREGESPMIDGMPMPPFGEGMPMPPMHNRFGGMPGMERRMRRAKQEQQMPKPQEEQELQLDSLSRKELVSIVRENGWDGEVDLEDMGRGEIIDFLTDKSMAQEQVEQQPQTRCTEESKIAKMIEEELQRNPQLREVVEKYIR